MKTIGIIGCGTMGAGIAQVAAQSGCLVYVYDIQQEALLKASSQFDITLQKLLDKGKIDQSKKNEIATHVHWINDLNALQSCELIIEAIVENLTIKQQLFSQLEQIVSADCILATNTSSLSITSIASACLQAHRVVGIHFFNPAPLMELVEVIPALQTSQPTLDCAFQTIVQWNKKAVIAKDTPGFIVNRIARPYYSEAMRIAEEGIADINTIDFAMKQIGFKMGPFELMDLIGHDINYTVTETVWTAFYYDTRYTPSHMQKRLVEAKWLGRKSGRGFYTYPTHVQNEPTVDVDKENIEGIARRILIMLLNEAANALWLQIASKEDIDKAMTKGVNYPKGLLQWADEFGIQRLVDAIDDMYHKYHEDRYRCCPLLRQMAAQHKNFY